MSATHIAFGESVTDTSHLKNLPRTELLGRHRFPAPAAYHVAVSAQIASDADPSLLRHRHHADAQRDWHIRGQNGCQFARLAARDAANGWEYLVSDGLPATLTNKDLTELKDHVVAATQRPETQVLSLLLPEITDPRDAVRMMRMLAKDAEGFWLERDEPTDDGQMLYLRYAVEEDLQAWIMAFAPFDFLPNTRRGPYFELAIRVKPKPEWLYHRLNQEKTLAHLADLPLDMPPKYWDDRFNSTLERTRRILGGEPDHISAAKATLVVPHNYLVD